MLKSIEKIKRLGVYQSYSKPVGTQDFMVDQSEFAITFWLSQILAC